MFDSTCRNEEANRHIVNMLLQWEPGNKDEPAFAVRSYATIAAGGSSVQGNFRSPLPSSLSPTSPLPTPTLSGVVVSSSPYTQPLVLPSQQTTLPVQSTTFSTLQTTATVHRTSLPAHTFSPPTQTFSTQLFSFNPNAFQPKYGRSCGTFEIGL